MHRIALALIVTASALHVSPAHADALTCGDYLSGDHQPDELPPVSQALAEAARACVCDTSCAPHCTANDGEGGNACELNALADFATLGGNVALCDLCITLRCAAPVAACVDDGS